MRLKKELKQAQLDRMAEATPYTKKGGRHLLQGRARGRPWELFGFIKAHQTEFPVETGPPVRMCKVLNVSRSGYYYWLTQRPTKRASENEAITQVISNLFAASKGRYGSPKITQDLNAQGVNISRPRVARLMKQANLKSGIQKKYVVTTTDSKHTYPVAENHLNRQFNPIKPGQSCSMTESGDPNENALAERVFRTLKEDFHLWGFPTFGMAETAVEQAINA